MYTCQDQGGSGWRNRNMCLPPADSVTVQFGSLPLNAALTLSSACFINRPKKTTTCILDFFSPARLQFCSLISLFLCRACVCLWVCVGRAVRSGFRSYYDNNVHTWKHLSSTPLPLFVAVYFLHKRSVIYAFLLNSVYLPKMLGQVWIFFRDPCSGVRSGCTQLAYYRNSVKLGNYVSPWIFI